MTHGAPFVELGRGEGQREACAAAAALDVGALPGRSSLEGRRRLPHSANLLLVLDNCEHVLGAAAALVDALLASAPRT